MNPVINSRMTARMEKDFVVFLIGMRINKFWKMNQWFPVAMAMPRMIRELSANPASGFLGAESWFGRTTIMVQYWESFDKLEAYARDKNNQHYPAWLDFNKRIRQTGDVGIWHETYKVSPGNYEVFYHNMPPFGLGKAGELVMVGGGTHSAKERMQARYQTN
jgi:hypothetical protein